MADGQQNEYEIMGMKSLNDGNAEYLRANQDITQDYNYFDNWYLNLDDVRMLRNTIKVVFHRL